jgi:hypothetical protein
MVWRLNRQAETKEGLDILMRTHGTWKRKRQEDLVVGEEDEAKEDVVVEEEDEAKEDVVGEEKD